MDDFTATTEAELRLYNPQITDFMITEDDGGTITEWKCTALVRIASKSYGVGHFGDVDMTFEVGQ